MMKLRVWQVWFFRYLKNNRTQIIMMVTWAVVTLVVYQITFWFSFGKQFQSIIWPKQLFRPKSPISVWEHWKLALQQGELAFGQLQKLKSLGEFIPFSARASYVKIWSCEYMWYMCCYLFVKKDHSTQSSYQHWVVHNKIKNYFGQKRLFWPKDIVLAKSNCLID